MRGQTYNKLKARISLILTVSSAAIWLQSISQSKLVIGDLGLINSLAPTYFIAYIALLAAFFTALYSGKDCTILLFFQSVLLVIFLWLTPPIIGGSQPALGHVYSFWGNVDYILANHRLSEAACWYHAWPTSWLVYTALVVLTGVGGADIVITIMPLFWELLYIPPLYLLITRIPGVQKKRYAWVGVWLFFLGNWVSQIYLSPQSLGYFFYLIFLYFFLVRITKTQDHKLLVLSLLMFTALTATHIITSLIVWSVALAYCIGKGSKKILLISFTAILVIWNAYAVSTVISTWAPQFLAGILDIERLLSQSLFQRFTGSQSRLDVISLRLDTTILVMSVGLVGFLISLIKERRGEIHTKVLRTIASIILFTLIFGFGIGFEMPYRAYFFVLPMIACFASMLLISKPTRTILTIVLVALLPLSIVSQYGNQLTDRQSPMDIAALVFFHNIAEVGVVAGAVPKGISGEYNSAVPFGVFRNSQNYWMLPYEDIVWKENIAYNYTYPLPSQLFDRTLYIPFGDRDRNVYDFIYNDTASYYEMDHLLTNSANINRVYSNKGLSIYASENWR